MKPILKNTFSTLVSLDSGLLYSDTSIKEATSNLGNACKVEFIQIIL